MMTLLVLRTRLQSLYQKHEIYLKPIFKFIIAIIVFQTINAGIGYDGHLKQLPIVLALSLLCAFTPSAVLVLLAALVSFLHIYAVSVILSAIILILFIIMYALFLRFTPRLGLVVLAVPILFYLNIPYAVPLLLGVFSTPVAIIPTCLGVMVYYLFHIIQGAAAIQVNVSLEDTVTIYSYVVNGLKDNSQLVTAMVVFSMTILVTWLVWKMKFDYAHEIAIAAGCFTNIFGFLISSLKFDTTEEIGMMIIGTVISGLVVLVIQFFHLTLDYSAVEHVQFEDDDYYYYVKAIPKINVTTPQVNVKRFNTQKTQIPGEHFPDDSFTDEEDYEDEE
ncbi:hypothetical protein [Anaerocolumna xylanovorans]|uniref:Uncharacterized protein n=1 Tax=Anaerocolumna xylanovorans DSM 12503 TaxID=1121345 RepID=A0A1M7YHT2_9FIRM|nr:hypothetical protein [Anaerocolumna xylanovorans]SHO52161.1 hypothetical protein SAMN02745217_03547 [Anaerocolumna xylanovorans DSM 12503]